MADLCVLQTQTACPSENFVACHYGHYRLESFSTLLKFETCTVRCKEVMQTPRHKDPASLQNILPIGLQAVMDEEKESKDHVGMYTELRSSRGSI